MYLLLELGPSIRRLDFGENIHVEVLYSKVHDHIWSVLPLLPVAIQMGDVFCFELVSDSDFQGQ